METIASSCNLTRANDTIDKNHVDYFDTHIG